MVGMTLTFAIGFVLVGLLLLLMPSHTTIQDRIVTTALAQPSDGAVKTFEMNGQIGSLVLGMPPNTKTVDMTTVPKFILSDDWQMSVNQGKLVDFRANFYTGPINGAENHTHQLSNFRINETTPIQF